MAVLEQYRAEPDTLGESLRHVVTRLRWMHWVKTASFGAFVGVCVSIAAIVLGHLDLLPDWIMLEALIPVAILIGIAVGTAFAAARPIPMMQAARLTDLRLGLKERLSSALEFEQYSRNERDPDPPLMVTMLRRDAAGYASALHPKDAVPFRMPWQLKALIAASVIMILAIVLPNLPIFVKPGDRLERAIVAQEGNKLSDTARVIEHQADINKLPRTQWAAQQMKRLGQLMARGHMNKQQALVRYSRLTEQMKDVQRQLAQQPGGAPAKSLSDAGRQLTQALQSQTNTPNGQGAANSQSNPSGQGNNASGKSAGKPGAGNASSHGFNIPGFPNGKQGAGQNGTAGNHSTNEVQQAAQAMQHGDAAGLSQQLRNLANRAQSGSMSPADKQQAQQDLQKLSDALKGTPLKDTQQHSQAAADAMKQGDSNRAADEMRKAADSADREMRSQQDQNSMQDAQNSLQKSQSEMAGAGSPSDLNQSQSGDSGQGGSGQGSGQGDSSGQNGSGSSEQQQAAENEMERQGEGSGQGNGPPGQNPGEENGGAGAANHAGHGFGHGSSGKIPKQKWEKFQGPANRLDSNFDPSKFPKYAKIYLGKPGPGNAAGRLGATLKTRPAVGTGHAVTSSVPYYNYVGGARTAAEHAVDSEDIPPAYKQPIHKYFDSLTPNGK